MKKLMFILATIMLFFLFSCINPKRSNQIESKRKDSIYWAEKEAKAILHADSVFTGFMDLKWNSPKKEAIKYFKASKGLKVDFITDDNEIYLKGSFAGSEVNSVVLTYFNDKLYDVWVDFGYKSNIFQQTLIENLEFKYGKSHKAGEIYIWDFGIFSSSKNHPKIYLKDETEGLSLIYLSKYKDEYEAEKQLLKDNKEKNTIKSKDL